MKKILRFRRGRVQSYSSKRFRTLRELVDQKRQNANLMEQISYYKMAITEVKDEGNADE